MASVQKMEDLGCDYVFGESGKRYLSEAVGRNGANKHIHDKGDEGRVVDRRPSRRIDAKYDTPRNGSIYHCPSRQSDYRLVKSCLDKDMLPTKYSMDRLKDNHEGIPHRLYELIQEVRQKERRGREEKKRLVTSKAPKAKFNVTHESSDLEVDNMTKVKEKTPEKVEPKDPSRANSILEVSPELLQIYAVKILHANLQLLSDLEEALSIVERSDLVHDPSVSKVIRDTRAKDYRKQIEALLSTISNRLMVKPQLAEETGLQVAGCPLSRLYLQLAELDQAMSHSQRTFLENFTQATLQLKPMSLRPAHTGQPSTPMSPQPVPTGPRSPVEYSQAREENSRHVSGQSSSPQMYSQPSCAQGGARCQSNPMHNPRYASLSPPCFPPQYPQRHGQVQMPDSFAAPYHPSHYPPGSSQGSNGDWPLTQKGMVPNHGNDGEEPPSWKMRHGW